MKLTTSTGKKLTCGSAVTTDKPKRLFLHLKDEDSQKVVDIFNDPKELPLDGYQDFTQLVNLTVLTNGRINVCLK